MAKPISRPTEKKYLLDKYDPTGEEYVTIRQATQQAHEQMSDLYSEVSRVLRPVGETDRPVEIRTRVSQAEVMRRAAWLTIVDCSLTIDAEDPAQPPVLLFKFRKSANGTQFLDMNEQQFLSRAWGLLPPELAEEIYAKVLDLNPMWGASGE
jgi:hypothetical protein